MFYDCKPQKTAVHTMVVCDGLAATHDFSHVIYENLMQGSLMLSEQDLSMSFIALDDIAISCDHVVSFD